VPMISVRNLLKQYDGKTALNQLSLEVGQGVIFGLLGPNGAGKTTLVSILNGLTDFQEGAVEVLGLPLRENLRTIRKQCSLIPQSLAFYDNLSVLENLRFFAGIQNIKAARLKKNIDYAIGVNRLEGMLEQKAATLSGGQKRRLNIAIGLLNDPQILYFDEPTVGIDPESRNEILETIKSFKDEKKTVIYTSHYMPEIEKICDEVAIINRGEIVKKGTLQNMLHEEDVSSAVIEIYETPRPQLDAIALELETLRVIDASTLMLEQQTNETMAFLLNLLEKADVRVKQIRFGTTNLESLFIRLTSQGGGDA
jgi:ABC-2 type transport system ATP-binding protein